jgi:predicted CopG family antitoxin
VGTVADAVRNRGVERVPYKRVAELEGVEFRRYPGTIRVRTTAPTGREAFFRLLRYIDGANGGGEAVSMTAPVASSEGPAADEGGERDGESISMTAPVATEDEGDGVTMSFFLPTEYTPETAPEPTEDGVELVVDAGYPGRTEAPRTDGGAGASGGRSARRPATAALRRAGHATVAADERGRRRGRLRQRPSSARERLRATFALLLSPPPRAPGLRVGHLRRHGDVRQTGLQHVLATERLGEVEVHTRTSSLRHLAVRPSAGRRLIRGVERRIHMGTKSVRIDESLYERIAAHKREDETFSEAIERLIGGYSLLDFAGGYTEEEAERHRELLEESEQTAEADRREMLERMRSNTE